MSEKITTIYEVKFFNHLGDLIMAYQRRAASEQAALILCQAEQIKNGADYHVYRVRKL
jgi:hypothetical protein